MWKRTMVFVLTSSLPFMADRPAGPVIAPRVPALTSSAASAGVDPVWLRTVTERIHEAAYEIAAVPGGAHATNPKQDLRTEFGQEGIDVRPRDEGAAWRLSWRTTAWGRAGAMNAVGRAAFAHEGHRAEYARDGFTEWYENRMEGLEQGFTIDARPPGTGPVRIEGAFEAPLRAEPRDEGAAIVFHTAAGTQVLRYEKLVAWDADGQDAPAHMELDGNRIALVVDDHGARYPLTIDPLLSTASWTVTDTQIGSSFGAAVSTAGDVNGDGYSDVVVGAAEHENGQSEEGRVFLYLGSALGLSTSHAQSLEINVNDAFFGQAVAAAGDVNGDGFDDVIVGAPGYGASSEGAAFLFLGSPWGLDTTYAWSYLGDAVQARFGSSVAGAGSVNGDEFAAVTNGAWPHADGQANEGRAYVFHGNAQGLELSPAWTYENNLQDSFFGTSVSTAGDVNGDGYDDVIIGAPGYTNGQSREGAAYVFHGSSVGLQTSPVWIKESNGAHSNFGQSVSTAGDYNGDGYADVIIGQPRYGVGQTDEGRIYVWLGSFTGLVGNPAFTQESNVAGALLGQSVGTAGDIDGNGFAEAVAGAPGYDVLGIDDGLIIVYEGNPQATLKVAAQISLLVSDSQFGWSVGTAGDTDGNGYAEVLVGSPRTESAALFKGSAWMLGPVARTYESNQMFASMGFSVASAGDVNGDGYDDVIIGSPYYNGGAGMNGAAFVYLGFAGGISAFPDWLYVSSSANAFFGAAVASAGDVNGDGYGDVVVGAPFHSTGSVVNEGAVYVFHGSPTGVEAVPAFMGTFGVDFSGLGWAVGCAGDVNGDGYSDVIVGAPEVDYNGTDSGYAGVYHGSPTGIGPFAHWVRSGVSAFDRFGASVGTAGDVNGDGYSDVIIGADGWSDQESKEGGAFVYYGSATGLNQTYGWSGRGEQEDAHFGASVATAGDVNGDGYSDIIVGAPYKWNTVSQPDEGMAFVYYGSPTGPSTTPDWEGDGDQAESWYGWSVASAGDVNGDGYSDVIVGAMRHDLGEVDEGVTFMYRGSAAGLSLGQDVSSRLDSDKADSQFGFSVACAGDLNGDGFSDVIVGAPGFANPTAEEGKVFVHLGGGGDGQHGRVQQRHPGDKLPIAPLGPSESDYSVFVSAISRSPGGRAKVRLEVEAKALGEAFDGQGTFVSRAKDSGAPGGGVEIGEHVNDLEPDRLYRWRARILSNSPLFPRSKWFHMSGNAPGEMDFRTTRTGVSVESLAPERALQLRAPVPNPFRNATRLAFVLPRGGTVRLSVHDVAGREVARPAEGEFAAGPHEVAWDGRSHGAAALPAGLYFARFSFEGRIEHRKLVLRP
jgi:hypothetical protein